MDREKVIKGLECCSNSQKNRCEANSCPYWVSECCCIDDMLNDALALLKEQQQQIWEFQDQVEYLMDKQKEQKFLVDSDGKITPLPVVVRCKDCIYGKHEKNESTGNEWIYCGHHRENRPKDWFCASGSRI